MQQLVKLRIVQGIITVLVTIVVGCTHEERNRNLVSEPAAELAPSFSKQPRETNFFPMAVPVGKYPVLDRNKAKRSAEELTEQDKKELNNMMRQFQEATIRLGRTNGQITIAIYTSTDWQEADRKVREQLASIAQDPHAFELEQTAAYRMLSQHLLRGEEVPKKKKLLPTTQSCCFRMKIQTRKSSPEHSKL